jgi:hypothetical protein
MCNGGGVLFCFLLRHSHVANTPTRRFYADADLAYLAHHLTAGTPSSETCYSTPACRRRLRPSAPPPSYWPPSFRRVIPGYSCTRALSLRVLHPLLSPGAPGLPLLLC